MSLASFALRSASSSILSSSQPPPDHSGGRRARGRSERIVAGATNGLRGRCGIMARMTKLLEKAIEKVRELPAEDQDTVAVAVLSMTEETPVTLDDETRVAIREGLEQARRGEFVPDEEIDALWKQHGL